MTDQEMPSFPRRSDGVWVKRRDEGSLFLDKENRRLCVADDTAVALWELCDGETSVAEMVDAIRQLWRVDVEVATADIVRALDDLAANGAIDWPGRNDFSE